MEPISYYPSPSVSNQAPFYFNNPLLKKKGTVIHYTEEQIQELVKCSNDIVYFMKNYVYIVSLDEGKVLFNPYDYQEEILRTCKNNRFSVFCLGRQLRKNDHNRFISSLRNYIQ